MNRQTSYISFAGACFAMFVILLSGCANVPIEREKIVEQWCAQPENDCFTPDTLPTGRAFSTQVEIDVLLKAFCEEYPNKCTELKLQLLPPDSMPDRTSDHPDDLLGGIRHDPDENDDKPEGDTPSDLPDNPPDDNICPGSPSPPGQNNPGDKGGRSDHGKGDHSAGKGGGHDRGDHDGREGNGRGNGHGRGGGNNGNGRGNGNNK